MARTDTYPGANEDINQSTDEQIRLIIAKLADAVANVKKESPPIETNPVATAAAERFLEVQSRLGLIAPPPKFVQEAKK